MDSKQISCPIVLACDKAYAMPLATALRSAVESNKSDSPLEFHVLTDSFPKDMQKRVFDSLPAGSASINWVTIDLKPFENFTTLSHISKITYARFLIPELFPDSVSKVLYLDADILVLDDLGPLWETDLEGFVLGAVLDRWDQRIKDNNPGLERVPRVRDYFNAGVLLVDLNRWRKERISEKALQYLVHHPHSLFSDQDALNVACDGLWKRLNSRWNFHDIDEKCISTFNPHERPPIVHFAAREKPWNAVSFSLNASFYDAFRSRTHFARTPWDKLCDMTKVVWIRVKSNLKRYALVRAIWTQVMVRRA
jgi:lipopolysaccharide biosynthesis glycosyltransferase